MTRRLPARSWPDWIGFSGFAAFAAWLVSGPRSLGIFLVVPVTYELAMAVTFLLRRPAHRSIAGLWPRVAAYGATFLVPVFVRLALVHRPSLVVTTPPVGLQIAGASLWLFGVVLAFWPLWHLRSSFSVEPAARRLVTSGPYRIARHPIYVSYGLNYAGLLLLHLTAPMVAVVVIWIGLTIVRTRFEERVLTGAFPEYAAYRRRVGAFGPVPRRGRVPPEDDAAPGENQSRAIGSPMT